MKSVYLIQSIPLPDQKYIGITKDFEKRLIDHNTGKSPHTSKFKPCKLIAYFNFSDDKKAISFKKYLKSGSGRAVANKHFWD